MGKMGDLQVVEKSGLCEAGKFLPGNSETMGRGYLANRPGVFLTRARVKSFKMIKPRLPS